MKSTDGWQSPTTKDERHNSTKLSFWNFGIILELGSKVSFEVNATLDGIYKLEWAKNCEYVGIFSKLYPY